MRRGFLLGWVAAMIMAPVFGQTPAPPESRGESLYLDHCGACHSKEVHWREQRLARDFAGLEAQVRRWQVNEKLGWGDVEVGAVTRYLNALHYRFPEPGGRELGRVMPLAVRMDG